MWGPCTFASHHISLLRPWNITQDFPFMEDVPAGNIMLSCFLFNCSSVVCWPVCHCPFLVFIYNILYTLINLFNILPHQTNTLFFLLLWVFLFVSVLLFNHCCLQCISVTAFVLTVPRKLSQVSCLFSVF